ncbi:uncharacterized protein LOC119374295 [Rhipicephalus sanguineus]|uniref:uncharacterized protein LOC119374295 n=1 Tax=Rhipicephalus sanguineus TaxID=34632 RepID=UPI0018962813|nr:uncharacterized protein LOC119374295 [Rhipicephalus sanguineus]
MLAEVILTCVAALTTGTVVKPQNTQQMHWCGGQLNPLDHARAMRFATSFVYSCKDEVQRFKFPPTVIKEIDRICSGWRFCYALLDDYTNASVTHNEFLMTCARKLTKALVTIYPHFQEKYKFDLDAGMDALQVCSN